MIFFFPIIQCIHISVSKFEPYFLEFSDPSIRDSMNPTPGYMTAPDTWIQVHVIKFPTTNPLCLIKPFHPQINAPYEATRHKIERPPSINSSEPIQKSLKIASF